MSVRMTELGASKCALRDLRLLDETSAIPQRGAGGQAERVNVLLFSLSVSVSCRWLLPSVRAASVVAVGGAAASPALFADALPFSAVTAKLPCLPPCARLSPYERATTLRIHRYPMHGTCWTGQALEQGDALAGPSVPMPPAAPSCTIPRQQQHHLLLPVTTAHARQLRSPGYSPFENFILTSTS